MFKVRASYGELGNENIGEYMYQAVMSRNNMTYNFNGNVVTGSAVSTFVDSNLAWEKKKTYNVGIDLALFGNRLEFTAEWYQNISEDLLYAVPVSGTSRCLQHHRDNECRLNEQLRLRILRHLP